MSLEDLEVEGVGGVTLAALVVLVVLGVVLWYKARHSQLPAWMYPQTAWGNLATGVDGVFNGPLSGIQGGSIQRSVDRFFSTVFGFFTDHLPSPPVSPGDGTSGGVDLGAVDGNYGGGPQPSELDQVR